MPLPTFKSFELYTLSIECERLVVTPRSHVLSIDSYAFIAAAKYKIKGVEVKHDITLSMLEISIDRILNINQAAYCARQRSSIDRFAAAGVSLHKWQRQEVCNDERYDVTLRRFGSPICRRRF